MKKLHLPELSLSILLGLLVACTPSTLPNREGVAPEIGLTAIPTLATVAVTTTAFPFELSPHYGALFVDPQQVTDGRLALFIEEVDSICHDIKSETFIKMHLSFQNMTNESLMLQSRFLVSPNGMLNGDIVPNYFTDLGDPVHSSWDYTIIETDFGWAEPDEFVELRAKEKFETILDVNLPPNMVVGKDLVSLPSGHYLVNLVYSNVSVGADNTWTGIIGSNPFEICVRNSGE